MRSYTLYQTISQHYTFIYLWDLTHNTRQYLSSTPLFIHEILHTIPDNFSVVHLYIFMRSYTQYQTISQQYTFIYSWDLNTIPDNISAVQLYIFMIPKFPIVWVWKNVTHCNTIIVTNNIQVCLQRMRSQRQLYGLYVILVKLVSFSVKSFVQGITIKFNF